jgi:hypothetical protein
VADCAEIGPFHIFTAMSTPLHPADQRRLRAWSAAVVILLVPAELVFAQRGGSAEGQSVEVMLEALRLGAFTASDPLTFSRYKSQSPTYDGHIGGGGPPEIQSDLPLLSPSDDPGAAPF